MRQIALDTETTGLDPELGHRIIEIGCVEITDRRIGAHFQTLLNPEREVDAVATKEHRLTLEQLEDQALFSEVCDEFLRFVAGAEIIIHNAEFDLGFLDAELRLVERQSFVEESGCTIVDSLELARDRHPGLRNSLAALCQRYNIDDTVRAEGHRALLDATLLARVYLAMTGGQTAFSLDATSSTADVEEEDLAGDDFIAATPVIRATPEALAEHERFMRLLREKAG